MMLEVISLDYKKIKMAVNADIIYILLTYNRLLSHFILSFKKKFKLDFGTC